MLLPRLWRQPQHDDALPPLRRRHACRGGRDAPAADSQGIHRCHTPAETQPLVCRAHRDARRWPHTILHRQRTPRQLPRPLPSATRLVCLPHHLEPHAPHRVQDYTPSSFINPQSSIIIHQSSIINHQSSFLLSLWERPGVGPFITSFRSWAKRCEKIREPFSQRWALS